MKEGSDTKDTISLREKVLLLIGCAVTVVWAISTLVQVALPTHPVPQEVHLVMLAVAGGFFGGAALESRRTGSNGNGNGKR